MSVDLSSRYPSRLDGRPVEASTAGALRADRQSGEKAVVERALLWVFIAGLAWCPFWFGSNILLAWGINAVFFPGLVATYELSLLIRGERHPVAIRQIAGPAALFVVVVLWISVQKATWTPGWLHHPIWQMSANELGTPVEGSISVNRGLTSLALLRLVTAASVFWLAMQLCRDAARANILLKSVAALSCAYAAYGLFALVLTPGYVLWFKSPFPVTGFVTSTFINPNSFATYAGMGVVVFCGLTLRLYRDDFIAVGGSARFKIATFIEVTGQAAILLGGGFITLVALLLSQSRGGVLSTALGLLVLGALMLKSHKERFAGQTAAIIFFGALLAGAIFYVYGGALVAKIMQQGFHGNRLAVYTITIRSIFDAPLLGYGYGTFADIFPMYRDQSLSTFFLFDHAHNTYLEVFQGLGLLFGSMLLASIVLLVLRCIKGAMTRNKNEMIPCIAAGVAVLVAVHSLVDFSLQIQAVTVTFMALLGAGVAQSRSSRLVLGD